MTQEVHKGRKIAGSENYICESRRQEAIYLLDPVRPWRIVYECGVRGNEEKRGRLPGTISVEYPRLSAVLRAVHTYGNVYIPRKSNSGEQGDDFSVEK